MDSSVDWMLIAHMAWVKLLQSGKLRCYAASQECCVKVMTEAVEVLACCNRLGYGSPEHYPWDLITCKLFMARIAVPYTRTVRVIITVLLELGRFRLSAKSQHLLK